jgi:hypothetical protein
MSDKSAFGVPTSPAVVQILGDPIAFVEFEDSLPAIVR